ncbi:phosphopantetheine-binding protein [Streptomyces bambusae]|uniref:Acyl carrier protein n=1 Tax=Streptomyces bambusae TaxID=1550616 RepID=A0ABS6Z2B9_9ACTN|nr:phosphopantetheine-binding protein [Streptomyces bambusae]MBW5481398.1 acyl carrier protein [Streptomyces bambusae]
MSIAHHPRTTLAEEVRTATLAWVAELLEEPEVELEDSFLELGGHSALALQLGEYAKERFGDEYDLMVLFEQPLGRAADELSARLTAAATAEAA